MRDPDRNMEIESITGIGPGTSTLIRRMSWLGGRGEDRVAVQVHHRVQELCRHQIEPTLREGLRQVRLHEVHLIG